MALAGIGQRGAERGFRGEAARLGGEDLIERGAPQAGRAGVVGTGRHQHGAAIAHITRDVVEIDDRQHALSRVAVEDDEVKLVDLLLEQLAGRERDQRELVDRRAVLLLRRTQNGEVHQVDAGVGLQQVAPGALAGMRLARHQQHAQLVAHAVDRDDGTVVDRGQLALDRGCLDLDDVGSGVRDGDLRVDRVARRDGAALQHLAVAAHRDLGRRAAHALIVDPIDDGLRLADDAEPRRGHQHDAAVALIGGPGDQAVHRRSEAERGGVLGHVVDAAVGQENRTGDPVGRHVGERRAERREQPRAVGLAIRLAGFDETHVEVRDAAEPLGQRGAGLLGLPQRGRRSSGSGSCRRPRRRRRTAARGPRG